MRVAVIGAGYSGLATVKILTACGHDVVAYDKAPDVGGVWSRIRRYPGLSTQNDKGTYALSDLPMPADYPEWPSGEQVQAYLQSYADHFDLMPKMRLSTEVLSATPRPEGGWTIRTTAGTDTADHLVVANGIFSDPFVPDYPGTAEFEQAGGTLSHASQFTDINDAADADVVVVGYGKSSCDVAVAVSKVASSTTVVARGLLWKQPKRIGRLHFKYLLLTRLGEGLFPYLTLTGFERFLHGPGHGIRSAILGAMQAIYERQLKLVELGLLPDGPLERIARSTVSLVTDGFFEAVASGTIRVHRDAVIDRLGVEDGKPVALLRDGTVLPADRVICGTGWHQRVPFLSEDINTRIHDERGNFELFRQILPHDVPNLTFCGYNSSFFSPLSSEIAALWIATHLTGQLDLPVVAERRAMVARRLRWMEERTEGKHARGTNIIPFSLHNIDELLRDMGIGIGRVRRLLEWVTPANPRVYADLINQQIQRNVKWVALARFGPQPGSASLAPAVGGAPTSNVPNAVADTVAVVTERVSNDEVR